MSLTGHSNNSIKSNVQKIISDIVDINLTIYLFVERESTLCSTFQM